MRTRLSIVCLIACISCCGQSFRVQLCEDSINAAINSWHIASPDSVFCNEHAEIDSVRFCCVDTILITAKKEDTSLFYNIRGTRTQHTLHFKADSVMSWAQTGDYYRHSVRINDVRFAPGTVMDYFDTRLNHYPAMLQYATVLSGQHPEYPDIRFLVSPDYTTRIKILENGKLHEDQIVNRTITKSYYSIGDTIAVKSSFLVLDSIDIPHRGLEFTIAGTRPQALKAGNVSKTILKEELSHNKPLLLDFWGTWCTYCIDVFPIIKDITDTLDNRIIPISICFDTTENIDLALDILDRHGVSTRPVFISPESPDAAMLAELNVTSFPCVILLDNTGVISLWSGAVDIRNNLRSDLNIYLNGL